MSEVPSAAEGSATGTERPLFVPPGHFYSPLVSIAEVELVAATLFDRSTRDIAGVDMREDAQVDLLNRLAILSRDLPFRGEKQDGLRYHYENPMYSWSDGTFLACMLRELRPQRIVEVGSGYSSALILDVNEHFLAGTMACTFIEPYPDLLHSLLRPEDTERVTILPIRLQDAGLAPFLELAANDVLFVDSTHVSKTGSDVNRLLFEIVPRLAAGVYVHFHDVFHPFEYPIEWVREGRSWNEAYLLRAFLQFNDAFEVVLSNTFLERFHRDWFEREMPQCLKNEGGSLWIRRKTAVEL